MTAFRTSFSETDVILQDLPLTNLHFPLFQEK